MASNRSVVGGLALAGIIAFIVTAVFVLGPRLRDPSRTPPAGTAEAEGTPAEAGTAATPVEDPAVAAALAAAAAAPRHPDVERNPEFPVYPRPEPTTIRVGPDTVWFVGRGGYRWGDYEVTAPPSFAWVRSTGRWVRLGFRPDLDEAADPLQPLGFDTVEVAPGVRLAHLPNHATRFHVLMLEDGSTRHLPDRIPDDVKRRLVSAVSPFYQDPDPATVAEFTVEGRVSTWLVADSVLWLGRAGSWTEGTGGLGGVVRYNLGDGRLESLWTEPLAASTVTGMARAAGRLWVGSLRPVEGPPAGHAGVLVLDPGSESWERLTPETSPLPGTLVWALAGAGDSVWISTDAGVAAVDAATGEWSVRYFQPVLVGDSLVQALVEERPDLDPVAEVAFRLMELLGVERRADFMAAVRRAPAEPFLEVYRDQYSPGWSRVVAHPDFVPFLEAAVRAGRAVRLALRNLEHVPGPGWDPAPAIALLESGPGRFHVTAAAALARAGHPEGLTWLRDRLAAGDDVPSDVFRALGEAGDTASIPRIATFLGDPARFRAAYAALGAMEADTAWRALLRAGREHADVRTLLLQDADAERGLSADHPVFGPEIHAMAHLALEGGEGALVAAEFLLGRGDTSGVAVMLDALEGHEHLRTIRHFIRMTGVDSAPPARYDDGPEARQRSTAFWRRWWAENGTSFAPVDGEAGRAALDRWYGRSG